MNLLIAVAVGSALGGISRYLMSGAIQSRVVGGFPLGTLVVNVAGSFLLGAIMRHTLVNPTFSPTLRLFLTAGFCGGFTTFSTFSFETLELLQNGQGGRAMVYMLISVLTGLAAAAAGYSVVRATAS